VRVGFGIDAHRFGGRGPLVLGGVVVDANRGLDATSDGDVAVHAIIDALLGAGGLGDLGAHFPSSNPRFRGIDSLQLLEQTRHLLRGAGFGVVNVDVTIIAQTVRMAPHRDEMRRSIAAALDIDVTGVSVKATTTDHLGFTGRDEGIAAMAVGAVAPIPPSGEETVGTLGEGDRSRA
jgi:2-C-methyl-D-erythritol 2,4-cyclodiphosphate synthase